MTQEKWFVQIPVADYEELLDDQLFLNCLRNAGVDNWEWYDEAVEKYNEAKETE